MNSVPNDSTLYFNCRAVIVYINSYWYKSCGLSGCSKKLGMRAILSINVINVEQNRQHFNGVKCCPSVSETLWVICCQHFLRISTENDWFESPLKTYFNH
jgi:hypothetical protein